MKKAELLEKAIEALKSEAVLAVILNRKDSFVAHTAALLALRWALKDGDDSLDLTGGQTPQELAQSLIDDIVVDKGETAEPEIDESETADTETAEVEAVDSPVTEGDDAPTA